MPRRSGARSATSSTRTPPRRVYAKGLASLELRLPPLGEGAHALLQVLALRHQGLRQRLLLEAGLEAALVGALEEALREAERERRPAREALAPAARRRLQVRAGTTLLQSPRRSASSAETSSARRTSSFALSSPTRRERRNAPPESMARPRRANTSMRRASAAMTTRSQASARCAPIPAATPLTARSEEH